MEDYYQRKGQPRIYPIGGTIGFTLLAHDAVPKAWLTALTTERTNKLEAVKSSGKEEDQEALQEVHRWYQLELERLLSAKREQEHPFLTAAIARAVIDRLIKDDGRWYTVQAYSLMSNHLHALLDFSVQCPPNYDGLTELPDYYSPKRWLGNFKGGTAYAANRAVQRTGPLWMAHNNYNRYIRNFDHLGYTLNYIARNPEKAGLVDAWRAHPYTYVSPAMLELFRL